MNRNQLLIIVGAVIVIIAVGLFVARGSKQPATPQITTQTESSPAAQQALVGVAALEEQNNSGESGFVYWQEKEGLVVVTIDLQGAPSGSVHPAHFHLGTCVNPGEIKYPLENVVGGKSQTTLEVSLAQLQQELPLVANVHQSPTQIASYVACGVVSKDAPTITEEEATQAAPSQ